MCVFWNNVKRLEVLADGDHSRQLLRVREKGLFLSSRDRGYNGDEIKRAVTRKKQKVTRMGKEKYEGID